MRTGKHVDVFDLFGPVRAAGPVKADEVSGNRKLVASIVGMFAAGMDTAEIGQRLVIRESIIANVLAAEREKQMGLA